MKTIKKLVMAIPEIHLLVTFSTLNYSNTTVKILLDLLYLHELGKLE